MLTGKSIIVTGAGSGIGRVTAGVLAARGARVIAADIRDESARETVDAITRAGGTAAAVHCNVAQEDSVAAMVAFAVKTFGRLDAAFNNAGVEMNNKPIHELTAAEWQHVIDVDLTGVFYCLKHEFLAMKQTGGGAILNTSSSSGVRGNANMGEYVAAKHGVVGLTKSAACDGGPLGIRVNALCPGFIMTPMAKDRLMNDPVFSQALDGLLQRHVIGRFGETEEVASMAAWLLSDESRFVTGAALLVDGGYAI